MKGITYFSRHGFSINEGSGPINIHVSWRWPWIGFYVFVLGWRWYWFRRKDG